MGKGLTDLEGPQGFAAQTSSATVILVSSQLGLPLSTTHVCSGGVLGSGVGRREAPVRWRVAGRMVLAWAVTLPSAAVVGALAGKTASTGSAGVIVVAFVGLVIGLGLYLVSRRRPIGPRHFVATETKDPESEATRIAA